ncbi:MAG TPA: response regulator [Pyrinomonadaceae bacterium]|jgi:DNA-binding NarL/FixJ family response regulator|nr:response regulator [Pyrinomonadaceae bacterium]
MYRKHQVGIGRQRQLKVLCIDNHASSTYAGFLLARCGYEVNCARFLCDAFDLIRSSTFDLYLVNDELARESGKEFIKKLGAAAGSTPVMFYSNIIYPFGPRSADQSGSTPETPVPVTEVAIAVARALANASVRPMACVNAA